MDLNVESLGDESDAAELHPRRLAKADTAAATGTTGTTSGRTGAAEAALSLEVVALREMAAVYFTITKEDVTSPPRPLQIDIRPKLPPKPKTVSGLSEARLSLASAANEIALQARSGTAEASNRDARCTVFLRENVRQSHPQRPNGPKSLSFGLRSGGSMDTSLSSPTRLDRQLAMSERDERGANAPNNRRRQHCADHSDRASKAQRTIPNGISPHGGSLSVVPPVDRRCPCLLETQEEMIECEVASCKVCACWLPAL
jgi:hypothetical protein